MHVAFFLTHSIYYSTYSVQEESSLNEHLEVFACLVQPISNAHRRANYLQITGSFMLW